MHGFYRALARERSFYVPHLGWMAFAMKKDVAPNPIDVRLLGAGGVMFHPQMPADAIE